MTTLPESLEPTSEGPPIAPSSVTFAGQRWSSAALTGMAAAWHDQIREAGTGGAEAIGLVMQGHPETVALLFALSALRLPVVLLHADARSWRSDPPFPADMPVFLAPASARWHEPLVAAGFSATVLPEVSGAPAPVIPRFLDAPGFVIFTSGSTGAPKPAFRSTGGLRRVVRAIAETYQLPRGGRVAGTLSLATSFGLTQNILLPAALGGHVGLLERFDHRSLLALWAEEPFDYWPGTALMADLLVRAPLGDWAGRAPAICNLSSGHVPVAVCRQFLERFGVPLRQSYGRSECSFITSERAARADIQPETVGHPSPGVEIRCGDGPESPEPPGEPGRIWIRAPWHSEGYGYPPRLEPIARPDGWCATEDLGALTPDGRLVILGRVDDCFKTAGGFLVSPALIAAALRAHPDLEDAAVVPLLGASGASIGILAATRVPLERSVLHELARQALPGWLRPSVVSTCREIPSLVTGKHDRAACIRLLLAEMASAGPEGAR